MYETKQLKTMEAKRITKVTKCYVEATNKLATVKVLSEDGMSVSLPVKIRETLIPGDEFEATVHMSSDGRFYVAEDIIMRMSFGDYLERRQATMRNLSIQNVLNDTNAIRKPFRNK